MAVLPRHGSFVACFEQADPRDFERQQPWAKNEY